MAKQQATAFQRALTAAALSRYGELLAADPEPVSFSGEYRAAVARLTRNAGRRTWKYVNTAWKRVLIAVILMALLAATVVAAVPALREGLIRFLTHDNGSAFSFEFTQEDLARAPKEIETYYTLGYVPEGYVLVDVNYGPTLSNQIYSDSESNILFFEQAVLWDYRNNECGTVANKTIDSENISSTDDLLINGCNVVVIRYSPSAGGGGLCLLWTDYNYFYSVFVNHSAAYLISNEEIVKIVSNLAPSKLQ